MDDALLGTDRAVADGYGAEIGGDAKAHALTVTAAFVHSWLCHCRPTLVLPVADIADIGSADWQKRTFRNAVAISALLPKADMCRATRDVRFGPKENIPRFTRSPRSVWNTRRTWLEGTKSKSPSLQ